MGVSADSGASKRRSWVWSVIPLNAGVQSFSTMAPLYILFLGGSVVQVGLITTLYNFVLIPASIFWGSMTDRMARRRFFFIVCCAGSTATFFLMYLIPNLAALAAFYGLLAVVVSSNSTAANLLVMETSEKKGWMSSYARLALFSSLGSILGLAVGSIWVSLFPIRVFLLFCGGATTASIVASFFLIPEPAMPLETVHLSFHPLGNLSRIYHGMTGAVQHLVISPPSPKEVLRMFRATRAGSVSGRALLFASTFFFMTATSLLNTAFTPFLVTYGVTDNEVFAISLINVSFQTVTYRVIGRVVATFGGARAGSYAALARTCVYMVIAFSALMFRDTALFLVDTAAYALVGLAFVIWNSSTSVMLFSSLGQGRQGSLLGGYAALSSLGTVLGALFAGYISIYAGYSTTFAIAAALLLVSFFILETSLKTMGHRGGTSGVEELRRTPAS